MQHLLVEASQINYFIWFDLFIFLIYFFFILGVSGLLRIALFSFIRKNPFLQNISKMKK